MILADNYGDVCAAEVILKSITTLIFSIYISPETTIKQKKYLMTKKNISLLVSGNFNIDIAK